MSQRTMPWTRRQVLGGTVAGVTALAGCLGGDDSDGGGSEVNLEEKFADVPEGDLSRPVRGDPEADVTLEVYTDFICPHCRTYVLDTATPLVEEYVTAGQIRYEPRNLPIPVSNPESYEAANAAWEVFERGGNQSFWMYYYRLYQEQERITDDAPDIYGELAAEFDLDADAIQSAGVNQAHSETVTADRNRGAGSGVSSTPGFVLNGQAVGSGADAVSSVMDTIDNALGE